MGDKKLSDKDKPGKIPGDAMQSREDDDESPNIEDEVVKLDPPAGAREPESMGEELDFTWECEGEDWYSYRTEDGWSEPLPASMLTVRCQLGILDSNTKLRSAVEGHDPAAVPAGVEGGLTVASLPGAEPADFMHTAAVTRTARKVSPAGGAAKAKKILAEIEKEGKRLLLHARALDAGQALGEAYENWWRLRTQFHRFPELARKASHCCARRPRPSTSRPGRRTTYARTARGLSGDGTTESERTEPFLARVAGSSKPISAPDGVEQAIRFVVIDRLITQGTRSEKGRTWCERIWTVLATCAQQGRRAFDFLCQAVEAHFTGRPPPVLLGLP